MIYISKHCLFQFFHLKMFGLCSFLSQICFLLFHFVKFVSSKDIEFVLLTLIAFHTESLFRAKLWSAGSCCVEVLLLLWLHCIMFVCQVCTVVYKLCVVACKGNSLFIVNVTGLFSELCLYSFTCCHFFLNFVFVFMLFDSYLLPCNDIWHNYNKFQYII